MRDDILNHEIWVSTGGKGGRARGTVASKRWSLRKLLDKLSNPSFDASITYSGYMKLPADEQAARKAAPGFIIAGRFKDGRRKISHQLGRSAIQIDIDYATAAQVDHILHGDAPIRQFCFLWHTTRAHCANKPRVRIIVPLEKMVDADQANAITRYLSTMLADDPEEAIEIPDLVSFRFNQIMYLPSVSKGQEFDSGLNEAPILDPKEFLDARPGWEDYSQLPRQERETSAAAEDGRKRMEDPTEKPGLIGAFCRAYDVEQAIEAFLSDTYVPGDCSTETRYTYAAGTGSNGAVVYDNGLFLHSHHGSDPAEGCHNAWDLVRLHRFGHLDDNAHGNTSPGNMPSFKAMSEFAKKDPTVLSAIYEGVADDFDDYDDMEDEDEDEALVPPVSDPEIDDLLDLRPGDAPSLDDEFDDYEDQDEEPEEKPAGKKKKGKPDKADMSWTADFRTKANGDLEPVVHNIRLICMNDPRFKDALATTSSPRTRWR